jgi:hypothetical protein
MDKTEDLKKLLDSIIAGNEESAKVSFHTYLSAKMKDMIGEKAEKEEAKAEKIEDSAEDDVKDVKKKAGVAVDKLEKAKKIEAKAEKEEK